MNKIACGKMTCGKIACGIFYEHMNTLSEALCMLALFAMHAVHDHNAIGKQPTYV
jgi:hypothetical protein